MTETIQVLTTTETEADAQTIANALVEKRLAGCVQIVGPITSTYWWKGKIETAEEWLCLIEFRHNNNRDRASNIAYQLSRSLPYAVARHSRRRLTTPATATTVDV